MKTKTFAFCLAAALAVSSPVLAVAATTKTEAINSEVTNAEVTNAEVKPGAINHDIFIKLKDDSPAAIQRQLELGREYLTGHPGELSFSATVLAHGITRHKQVSYLFNDTDFTVAFHIVFANAKAHNEYQVSKRHVDKFIPLSNPNWEKIRVFDSEVE